MITSQSSRDSESKTCGRPSLAAGLLQSLIYFHLLSGMGQLCLMAVEPWLKAMAPSYTIYWNKWNTWKYHNRDPADKFAYKE